MTVIINGAPVPPEIEAEGDAAIQAWYDSEGKRHPDHQEPTAPPPAKAEETEP